VARTMARLMNLAVYRGSGSDRAPSRADGSPNQAATRRKSASTGRGPNAARVLLRSLAPFVGPARSAATVQRGTRNELRAKRPKVERGIDVFAPSASRAPWHTACTGAHRWGGKSRRGSSTDANWFDGVSA
jgi:hypothetical protein